MTWRVTHINGPTSSSISHSKPLASGAVINFSTETEIRNTNGQIVRFKPGAEFSIEDGPTGQTAVYYGEIAIFGLTPLNGKYRTSCYVGGRFLPCDVHIKNLNDDTDRFSCYRGTCVITEYDEQNTEFVICTVDAGYWVDLRSIPGNKMRERYKVIASGPLTENEYSAYISDFGPPKYPVGL